MEKVTQLVTIEIPRWISRSFIQSHRKDLTFIYGDDLNGQHYMGQASHCKGEPNCYPIPTKRLCCMDPDRAFFDDQRFELLWKPAIDKAFDAIPREKPIIPLPKIGQGDAQLPVRAPKVFAYITKRINEIAYPYIQFINP